MSLTLLLLLSLTEKKTETNRNLIKIFFFLLETKQLKRYMSFGVTPFLWKLERNKMTMTVTRLYQSVLKTTGKYLFVVVAVVCFNVKASQPRTSNHDSKNSTS